MVVIPNKLVWSIKLTLSVFWKAPSIELSTSDTDTLSVDMGKPDGNVNSPKLTFSDAIVAFPTNELRSSTDTESIVDGLPTIDVVTSERELDSFPDHRLTIENTSESDTDSEGAVNVLVTPAVNVDVVTCMSLATPAVALFDSKMIGNIA